MNKTHELKTWTGVFDAVRCGAKTFEFRLNDRDYGIGDELVLREYDPVAEDYTGEVENRKVTCVLYGGNFGVPEGYCVMGLSPVDSKCKWNQDDSGSWDTSCGQRFVFESDGPAENHFVFCYHCGKPLVPVEFVELEEDNNGQM